MVDEQVTVPPDVYDELETLHQADELDPNDREHSKRVAAERGYESTVNWLEQIGEDVYERAARGEYTAGSEP